MTIQSNAINLQYFQIFEKQRVWVISNADKIPMQVSGNPSKVNDPNTWETLENVHQYCNTHQNCLPAIILSDHLNLIFLDLDDVIDPNTQKIEVWAQEVIDSCNSYTERSKSGRGIHIFLHGQPPNLPSHEKLRCRPHKKHWDKKGEIELYFTKKAATITGDVIVDQPIRSISEDGLASLYRKFFPKEKLRNERTVLFSPKMSDEEVLRLARSSKNSIKFTNLYDHADWDGAKDRSAMDLSLANYLAFYTQDLEQINRLMLSSALLREKWERSDYLDRTIETAVKGLSSAYQSKRSPSSPIPIKTTTSTTGDPFPVDCLPSILCQMAKEIHRVTKTPIELCGGTILSAASIATRGTVKVFEKSDLAHFICFFFMIIAESGERKSNVMKKALEPIYLQQEEDKEGYLNDLRAYRAFEKTAKHEEKRLLGGNKNSNEIADLLLVMQKELESHKPAPYRYLTDDFTVSALFRLLEENGGSFAVISLDGGNVLDYIQGKGHGTDGSLNDSLLLKATWGDPISRDRTGKNAEGEHLFIKDPACHVTIIVQPDRCRQFLSDSRLRGSGIIARIMPITCTSTIGTRFEEENEPTYNAEIVEAYNKCIKSLYTSDMHIEIRLSKEAASARRSYFNEIEHEMKKGSSLEDLRDLGSKAATQVTRIAALFELYKTAVKSDGILISEKTWYEAEAVGRWILDQAAYLQRTDYDELVLIAAKQINEKILDSNLAKKPFFDKRDFQQRFKHELGSSRGKQFVSDVLRVLLSHQWITEVPLAGSNSKSLRYRVNQGGA